MIEKDASAPLSSVLDRLLASGGNVCPAHYQSMSAKSYRSVDSYHDLWIYEDLIQVAGCIRFFFDVI